jgi:osmoprotectant transport system substrate-binding protein
MKESLVSDNRHSHTLRNRPVTAKSRRDLAVGAAGVVCAASMLLAACGGSSSGPNTASGAGNVGKGQAIKVGAYAFPEGQLLSNLYADALNAAGYKATIVQTQGRETGEPALSQGSLDVIPEYTSSLLDYFKPKTSMPDNAANYKNLTTQAATKGVTIPDKSAATDNYAFGVASSFAQAHNLTTLSSLTAYSKAHPVAVAGIQECAIRTYCLAGLKSTYGLNVASFKVTVLASQASVDLLTKNTVQLVQFDSSDGVLAANPVTILKDDKGLNHQDFIVPAVYSKVVTPALKTVLNKTSSKLTQADLNAANKSVQVDRVPAADAAKTLYKKLMG